MESYDAIIIGGGHNGLVTAAYLARAGRRVLVLEKRDVLGGACVTEEVWPGYRISTAAYLCSLLHPKIIRELELAKFGFEVYRRETGGFAPFPDGSYLMIFPDASKTRAELQRFCPEDVEAYFEFEADVERAAGILEPFFFGPAPELGQIADALRKAGARNLFEPLFQGSVRDLLEARFKSDRLMAVLATDGLIGTAAGVSDPGTAYVLLHHNMGMALGSRGLWGYVRGGMGRITQALADSAREYGAELRVNAKVARILARDNRASGLLLSDGTELFSDTILSNADPLRTSALLENGAEWRGTLAGWKTQGVSCKINLAVSELPDFNALPGKEPGPQHLGTIHLCPSMRYLESAWNDCRAGIPSFRPMIEMYIQTATDSGLAPGGKHILSCFTQYYPYNLAPELGPYDPANRKDAELYYDYVLGSIRQYAPNVRDAVEQYEILTPRDLEERFGLTGGHIFHGDITPDQMFGGRAGTNGPQTPVRGLYLCGSGAWPGGCVSGIPGYNAAHAVLGEWVTR